MKQYVLVRGDLSPGDQLAQVAHVCTEFAELCSNWTPEYHIPDTIVVLEVAGINELLDAANTAHVDGHAYSLFYEPDLNEYTALATVSTGEEYANLPLAGRGRAAMTVS